ncbi:MAG: hypothetical protein K6E13_05070 [Lachnospiraceae bacterium]|nr:hypothetical protein [Lachnospiraceae bacterium]
MRIYYELILARIKLAPRGYYLTEAGDNSLWWQADSYDYTVSCTDSITTAMVKYHETKSGMWNVEIDKDVIDKCIAGISEKGNVRSVKVISFAQFKKISNIKKIVLEESDIWYYYFSVVETGKASGSKDFFTDPNAHKFVIDSQVFKVMKTSDFYKMSDAMKVWTIDDSEYFRCNYERPTYGMVYGSSSVYSGSKGMKTLYSNKATGVCGGFAHYEDLVFKQLGIKCYKMSNFVLCHAWTVVKVKNSSGKVLWVPFDYGIGPSESLGGLSSEAKKLVSTEKARYKTYLSGIKGAPKKKNFKNTDFK